MDAKSIVSKAIQGMIDAGLRYHIKNGKVIFITRKSPNPPWRHFSYDPRMECALWKWVMYKGIVEQTPGLDFVPSPCHDCYKVVIAPNNLRELEDVEKLMLEICRVGFSGKCGIERREIARNYGAYIYCRGKEEAQKRFDMIRGLVPKRMPMHIQHSGTYYLPKSGPSATWRITEEQLEIEAEVMKQAGTNQSNPKQTPQEIAKVHAMWKDWANKHDLII